MKFTEEKLEQATIALLGDQPSGQFTNAKRNLGDQTVISLESRSGLRDYLKGRNSGGIFLTTIHHFNKTCE